ncbi:MAG: translation elongation factor Ts [Bacteroidota bacterium]|nr:translation elongation factor Ts [Candidatus Kapabacteria bacterium]MDW8220005.1 translation elongation factor Ts [Bacteroidota bacterium]
MAVTLDMVKSLREATGAGMADCKKALDEANGDMNGAIEYLRKRGAASAAKRTDRAANEGLIVTKTSPDNTAAAIVEINCETDFVARNEEFVQFVHTVAETVLTADPANEEALLATDIGGKKLGDLMNEMLAKFSERIVLKRYERLQSASGFIVDYIHTGNKLGVLLEFTTAPANDNDRALMRDIAMQIAAMSPRFIRRSDVDAATLTKEREIYTEQAIQQGKKPDIAQKIAEGRIEKFYQEFCLVEQTFVKDSGKTVSDVLKSIGSGADVVRFRRFFLGETTDSTASSPTSNN